MKKIIILGAGVYQVPLIKKAKEMHLYTVVVSYPGNYPGFDHADKVHYCDTTDMDSVLAIAKAERADGIATTGTDVAVRTIGRVCDALSLPGPTYESAQKATDKLLMKSAFEKSNVRTARFRKLGKDADPAQACGDLAYPLMLKAVDCSGSRGIVKVESAACFNRAVQRVFGATKKDYCVAEEFIHGEDFGAEAFIFDGKVEFLNPHGSMMHREESSSVPIGHYLPFELNETAYRDFQTQMLSAIGALGLNNCAVNADLILKGDFVHVLEMGGRAGATCLPELVSIHYGIDYYAQIIRAALGEQPVFDKKYARPTAGLVLRANKSGILRAIENANPRSGDILEIFFDRKTGDRVNRFQVGPDRVGQIIVTGKTSKECLDRLREAERNICFDIE